MTQHLSRSPALLWLGAISLVGTRVEAQRVVFDHPGYRLTSIGERVTAAARVVDGSGRPIPNASITFRVTDPTVAGVSTRGEVVSRKEGLTKVWAIAGRDSASAIVLVQPRAAKFAFIPAMLRLDALSARVPLKVAVSDAAGHPIVGGAVRAGACRSLDDRIATVASTGEVIANANGATYVRCADIGIADSVRVEVQQRATKASAPVRSLQKTVGDTFTVKLKAFDRQNKEIVDARPTWASLNQSVVSVDPSTGKAVSKGPGTTKVIVQLGDVADTVGVSVGQPVNGLMQLPAPGTDSAAHPTTTTVKAAATLGLLSVFMTQGETRKLSISAKDSAGAPVLDPTVVLRSNDTSIVQTMDSNRVKGIKEGATYVHARFGTISDSALVTVRSASVAAAISSSSALVNTGPMTPPSFPAGLAEKYAAQRDTALTTITSAGASSQSSARGFTGSMYAAMANHSSHQAPTVLNGQTAPLTEDRSGVMYGAGGMARLFSWMSVDGAIRTGQLTASGSTSDPLKVTEAEGSALFYLMPWLGLGGGLALRSESTPVARQTWRIPRVTAVARFAFVGDAVNTVTGLSLLPGATFSGSTQKPGLSYSGEAGLELHRGRIDTGIVYYIDRFTFPLAENATKDLRVEQFSTLRVRLGFRIGK